MNSINEARLFSAYSGDAKWNEALLQGSVSRQDAENRKSVYGKVYSRYVELRENIKAFSGITETPLMGRQFFNATMVSNARSFSGFISIERDMDQETALLYFMDLLGVTDNRKVLPNVGKENLNGINSKFTTTSTMQPSNKDYMVATGKKIIPGTVEIKLVHAATPDQIITITDDKRGNLLAAPGVLESGKVDYTSAGKVEFKVGTGFTIAAGDSFSISALEDVAGNPEFNQTAHGINRFKLDQQYHQLVAQANLLIGEANLMAIARMNKSMGVNPQDILGAKLTELYTKIINLNLVNALINGYEGNDIALDVHEGTAGWRDFTSQLNEFVAGTVTLGTSLAIKSTKGTDVTTFLVGTEVGNWFKKTKAIGQFVPVLDSNYVNDLIGYFDGVPVLQHTAVPAREGYAIHKTKDGNLAPLMRGIYLPLTTTPGVGNYQNPTQYAQGVYYSEANDIIVPELVQKFHLA